MLKPENFDVEATEPSGITDFCWVVSRDVNRAVPAFRTVLEHFTAHWPRCMAFKIGHRASAAWTFYV